MAARRNYISSSFFHFTRSLDSVKGILKEGFKMYHCIEDIYIKKGDTRGICIPMLCFCDIPISYIDFRDERKYGFGMNKRKWAWRKVNFQPVIYYPNNSRCKLTKMIIEASKAFLNGHPPKDYEILGISKPYYSIKDKAQCNYLDNEWRIIGDSTKDWFSDSDSRCINNQSNGSIKPSYGTPILYKPEDVEFIIVPQKDKAELLDFIWKDLSQSCGINLSQNDKIDLISKVIIREDFVRNI
ncbi:MAG: hypothetical protein IJJ96_00465 [Bacteroidales bacterium]|nr:hypothetical protein [Bacteroidales bacterium]